jgi:hypothetical protein
MPNEIIPALVAVLGVILSGLVSLVTSRKVALNEFKKMRFEAKRTYDAKLFEERLKRYPTLFFLLSKFIKEIEFGSVSRDAVEALMRDVNTWDSEHAIVLSQFSADACYEFRHHLRGLLREGVDSLNAQLSSQGFLQDLRRRAAIVEFVLRSDIGIYGIENSEGGDYDLRVIDSYEKFDEMRGYLKVRESRLKKHMQERGLRD